jgi:hypothetical protein
MAIRGIVFFLNEWNSKVLSLIACFTMLYWLFMRKHNKNSIFGSKTLKIGHFGPKNGPALAYSPDFGILTPKFGFPIKFCISMASEVDSILTMVGKKCI